MFDYVISYDIAAFILIGIFIAFFFSRRRFKTLQTTAYSLLIIFSGVSVLFDLTSVTLLIHRNVVPVWINYTVNILYFLITGFLAVIFCAYSLNATNSLQDLMGNTTYVILFEIPYILYSISIVTTPFTKLVFYFDEKGDYKQGPLMIMMLVIMVFYLLFSTIRMTLYRNRVSLRRRLPYYLFIAITFAAIVIQNINSRYLLFGFASALGIVTLFLLDNNANDFVDFSSQLFNRNGFRFKLDDMQNKGESARVAGFGFYDRVIDDVPKDALSAEVVVSRIGTFLTSKFNADKVFYLGHFVFAILTDSDEHMQETVSVLKTRFAEPWKVGDYEISIDTGLCELMFPDDFSSFSSFVDNLENGIKISLEKGGEPVGIADIRQEQQKKIEMLEQAQEILKEKYDEAEIKMQKALEADKSKSLFLAQMSHEIRTPMTAILGMTELLFRDTDDPRVRDHASAIMSSGKTLLGIINDILDFSKLEAGKFQVINSEYYFTSTFYDILNNIEQKLYEKHLDFVVYFDPKIPAALFGDEVRIKQVIINLLTNACKYTEVGKVELNANVSDIKDDMCVLNVSVSDTGVGIAPENMEKLFDGFERLGAQKNKDIEGTGLGLAITKQLLDNMNGSIEVKSEVARGSVFTVHIPQKIVDSRDSIVLEGYSDKKLLIYCATINDLRNYRNTTKDFDLEVDFASSSSELDRKIPQKDYTHIIITLAEYQRRVKAGDPLADDPRVVISLYYKEMMADVKGHMIISMPVSSINLSSLLLDNTKASKYSENDRKNDYVAPGVNMLVVDDNQVNLRIFVGLLENHKFNIYTSDNGMHCIELCEKMKFDLIFLDHMMPKKDGIQTLHEMREDPDTLNADTPVVAFTANAVSGMKDMFLEQGFNDFLSKPIEITKLEDILSYYLPDEKIINIMENAAEYNEIMNRGSKQIPQIEDDIPEEKDQAFSIEGLDMEQALFYSGNNYETLKNILEVFVEDGSQKLDLLVKYIEEEDFENYRIEIHAVKSLCKGIGANELSEKALKLETACKEGDHKYVIDHAQEAYTDYVILIGRIDEALSALNKKNDDPGADKQAAAPVLNVNEQLLCIKLLLSEFEEDIAIRLADDLESRDLPSETKEKIKEICKMLHLYDYEGALGKIEVILNED